MTIIAKNKIKITLFTLAILLCFSSLSISSELFNSYFTGTLTDNRIVTSSGGALLTDSENLTFDGSTFAVNADVLEGSVVRKRAFTKTGLTNNSPMDIFTITVGTGENINGYLHYGMTTTGGSSDIQSHSGDLFFVCVNKEGTITKDINEAYTNADDTKVVTAGTQADTWAMKAGNVCTVTLNMNSNLSSPVNSVTGIILIYGNKNITLN